MLRFEWKKDERGGRNLTLNGMVIARIVKLIEDKFYVETVEYSQVITYDSIGEAKRAAEIMFCLPRKQAEERQTEEKQKINVEADYEANFVKYPKGGSDVCMDKK